MNRVIHSDLLKYLRDYQHVIRNGFMPKYHAVLCDPPYYLGSIVKRFGAANAAPAAHGADGRWARLSTGFMGQTWDGFDSPQSYQAWVTTWAEMLLDYVYPGGVLIAFGGTRTYHRLVSGLEDAGWEIYDSIMAWTYGCISEDTEILTENGWEKYSPELLNKRILCYNKDMDLWQWEIPIHVWEYDYSDTAYRIQSDTTDQLVSRNHRCIIEREGTLLFEFAENLASEHEIRVPALESLSGLLNSIRNSQQHTSETKQILSALLRQQRTFSGARVVNYARNAQAGKETKVRTRLHTGYMPYMWNRVLQAQRMGEKSRQAFLLRRMFAQVAFNSARTQELNEADSPTWSYWLDGRNKNTGFQENDWQEQPLMEWGNYLSETQGTLCLSENQVCALSPRTYQHGTQGWLRDGTPLVSGKSNWQTTDKNRVRTSYQSQRTGQSFREFDAISEQSGTQAVRSAWRPATHLARITPVHYEGIMWCPCVPSGAFVARRNGHIFVTGNSGFPKSLDISKTIEKQGGTPEQIEQFSGMGTSLKPSYEPIVLARAPRAGYTYADCATQFGSGALNIDECRIDLNGDDTSRSLTKSTGWKQTSELVGSVTDDWKKGRFPANTMLVHHPECNGTCHPECHVRVMGEQSGESVSTGGNIGSKNSMFIEDKGYAHKGQSGLGDTGSAARFFYQAKAASWERDAGLADMPLTVSGGMQGTADKSLKTGSGNERNNLHHNPHPTVKPIQLITELAKLILPPIDNARLLVPFAGSGSEMIGAYLAGWKHITGIEMTAEYIPIARARLAWWERFDSYAMAESHIKNHDDKQLTLFEYMAQHTA